MLACTSTPRSVGVFKSCTSRPRCRAVVAALPQDSDSGSRSRDVPLATRLRAAATPSLPTRLAAAAATALLLFPMPSHAEVRLPPLDNDPNRCERAVVGNTIGQANAVSDKVLDLRYCKLGGRDLGGKTLSGALLVQTDLSKANLVEAVFSKAYAVEVDMSGANLTSSVVDRVALDKANLQDANFTNAVITGSTFDGANLKGAIFEDALIGSEDAKRLCANPTLEGESRDQVGCRR